MAKVKLVNKDEYAIVVLENIEADFTGQGVMQDDSVLDANIKELENGMAVSVKGKKIILPAAKGDEVLLHATPCEIYENEKGRNSFRVVNGKGSQPRFFALNKYDVFSTNAATYEETDFADVAAIKAAINGAGAFVVADTDGYWSIVKTVPAAAKLHGEVLDVVELPNETVGIRIRIA